MARKKRNRCRVKSCSVVIDEKYFFCYHHRMWSLHDVNTQFKEPTLPTKSKPIYRRFFCDPCGTVIRSERSIVSCQICGRDAELLGE